MKEYIVLNEYESLLNVLVDAFYLHRVLQETRISNSFSALKEGVVYDDKHRESTKHHVLENVIILVENITIDEIDHVREVKNS